jgi:hypothetical protein
MTTGNGAVEWPIELGERTPRHERTRNNHYEVTLSRAFKKLEEELERLDVDDFRYSFDAPSREVDGRPYKNAKPDDPAFLLRWTKGGEQFAVGCDAYSRLRDNVRTVGLYVNEKRMMESRDVATGDSEFSNLRLPAPDDVEARSGRRARDVLDVRPHASREEIREAYREKIKEVHPDNGGTVEAFREVQDARDELLERAEVWA